MQQWFECPVLCVCIGIVVLLPGGETIAPFLLIFNSVYIKSCTAAEVFAIPFMSDANSANILLINSLIEIFTFPLVM